MQYLIIYKYPRDADGYKWYKEKANKFTLPQIEVFIIFVNLVLEESDLDAFHDDAGKALNFWSRFKN